MIAGQAGYPAWLLKRGRIRAATGPGARAEAPPEQGRRWAGPSNGFRSMGENVHMKPVTNLATFLLAVVSLAHLMRLIFGVRVTVADSVVPMWVSGVAFVVAGGLAIMLRRGARTGR